MKHMRKIVSLLLVSALLMTAVQYSAAAQSGTDL